MSGTRRKTESYGTRRKGAEKKAEKMTGTRKRVACAAALAVTAALTGLFFMWESPAKPAEKRTAAATATAEAAATEAAATEETNGGFRMLDGASVRLSKDGDFYGIRFGAKVEDATKRYAMLIVPATLAAGYEQGKESGETLSASRGRSWRQGSESGGADGGRRERNIVRAGERAVGESEPRV